MKKKLIIDASLIDIIMLIRALKWTLNQLIGFFMPTGALVFKPRHSSPSKSLVFPRGRYKVQGCRIWVEIFLAAGHIEKYDWAAIHGSICRLTRELTPSHLFGLFFYSHCLTPSFFLLLLLQPQNKPSRDIPHHPNVFSSFLVPDFEVSLSHTV